MHGDFEQKRGATKHNRLLIAGVIVLAAIAGWIFFMNHRGADGITIQGDVIATDLNMVYTAGTPAIAPGGVDNGCNGFGLTLGKQVTIEDTQGKPVAYGEITKTFHWEGSPNLAVDRSNHGCDFTYVVKGVPKLDAYDITVGILVSAHDVRWDALDYHSSSSGVIYLAPPIKAGS